MNYAHQYLRSAEIICGIYEGSIPLASFLRQYFQQHKKFGSKDRKHISHICYCYYRLGRALTDLNFTSRTKAAVFLCQDAPGVWSSLFDDIWLQRWTKEQEERIAFIQEQYPLFAAGNIFPCVDEISDVYDRHAFTVSHLTQPDMFLRIRPGYHDQVKQKLTGAGISFQAYGDDCLALPNASKIDTVLETDRECVVQDFSSQRVQELFGRLEGKITTVWDCCAASGGKSLLAWDTLPGPVQLMVSDIRPSIIHNLRKRFQAAGVHPEKIVVADLTQEISFHHKPFDLVICDVPCTGSGTWGRTPEQLCFFDKKRVQEYAQLQEKIVNRVLPQVRSNGYLLYITCSVFSQENEMQTAALLPKGMEIVHTLWLKGYTHKADSMFACLLRKAGA
jgi:16S rRNA (cytosine967-C5)-methyltransferase